MSNLRTLNDANQKTSMDGFGRLSLMEKQRDQANDSISAQNTQRRAGALGNGVGSGIAAASIWGGPVGLGVGVGVAILGGLL